MKYAAAYIGGGIVSFFLANKFWYPAPNISGVALGLLDAAIFLTGSAIAIVVTAIVSRQFRAAGPAAK
jgi:hypothetical protein